MYADGTLPLELSDLINAELTQGERAVWVGQPNPGRFARTSIGIVLFAIPWTAFSVFWIAGASGFKWPDFSKGFGIFPLFGIPFVLVGLGMLSSPLWMRRKAKRTAYVITDKRAIVLTGQGWRGVSVRSFEPDCLTDLERTQYPDGSGNLVFHHQYNAGQRGAQNPTDVGFMAVANVKEVEDLVRELVHHARQQQKT
jgi:hypothetical protein